MHVLIIHLYVLLTHNKSHIKTKVRELYFNFALKDYKINSMKINKVFISIILTFICYKTIAEPVSFYHLTTQDGLINNTINCIHQDKRGFMWFGTKNGINIYNGNTFITHKHEKNNKNSILSNRVTKIINGHKDTLFIMTSQGISCFNISENKFSTLIKGHIDDIAYDNKLYVSQDNFIYRYENKQFIPIYEHKYKKEAITHINIKNDNIIFCTNKSEIYELNIKTNKIKQLIKNDSNISSICKGSLYKDKKGRIWIGTYDHGAYIIDKDSIHNLYKFQKGNKDIIIDHVRTFCEDEEGNIYLGAFNGLIKYDNDNNISYYVKENTDYSLSHSSITSLFCDKQGTVWIGTYYGGVNYFNIKKQPYKFYQFFNKQNGTRSGSITGYITGDNMGNVWVGTEGGGIVKLILEDNNYKWFVYDKTYSSLTHNNIKSLYIDNENKTLWIGTHTGGLNKMNIITGTFKNYILNKNRDSNIIREIIPYKNNLVLITHEGIYLFDKENENISLLINNISGSVSGCIDKNENIWVMGNGLGVYKYNIKKRTTKNYRSNENKTNSLSSNIIRRIYKDSKERIWFCTDESGIDLYRPETDDFENFDESRNGIASNNVYDACELSDNEIIFTTEKGFSILDLRTKKFKNFSRENGIPLNAISERSLYKSPSGEIYIGGLNGMISFRMEDILSPITGYSIYPYEMYINGDKIKVNDNSKVLKQALTEQKEISLNSSQSMFSIEYATTNYIYANKERLEFFLEGFSNKWTDVYDNNIVTFTNLNPGKYVLKVRVKNNPGIKESSLIINVLPPFYMTVWAYIVYVIIASIIVYWLLRMYNNRIKLQETIKYEKQRAKDIEEMTQSKLIFFTNISHEFRTPLTLIIGQIELLLKETKLPSGIENKIKNIYKNSILLKELITELLDFRKQEQGHTVIKAKEQDIVGFINNIYLSFKEFAEQKQIKYSLYKNAEEINVWFDEKQMKKVLYNLISNAFKHTPKGGEISVSVIKTNHNTIIEVTDNGEGIAEKDLNRIFDRFFQTDKENPYSDNSTGIGLALTKGIIEMHHGTIDVNSKEGKGACFSIQLKTGKEHFNEEELDNTDIKTEKIPEEKNINENTIVLSPEYNTFGTNEDVNTDKNRINLLIVEDEESIRKMLNDIFSPYYTVREASNGEEGWDMISSENPDIIISDVKMPKMSGIELCKKVKSNIDTCHIPVILLTSLNNEEDYSKGLNVGADDYMTKPFNINILLSKCNSIIKNRRLLQEKFCNQPQVSAQTLTTNTLDKKVIDNILEVIENNLDNPEFSIEDLANSIGMARTKLFTKIKSITGQTPYDFIITIKLKKATEMLIENPELNISEISYKSGFSTPRQFSKYFKEKYHVVPQEYRKKL